MEGRYDRNLGTIDGRQQALLQRRAVCVVGCGGLGGGIIENLARLGVGKITIVDGDVFHVTNLNRQILCDEKNLGCFKAEEGAKRVGRINSEITVCPVSTFLEEHNSRQIIHGHDAVIDALDNVRTRVLLERACEEEDLPLVHGAIAGWSGQVAVVLPGAGLLRTIYAGGEAAGDEKDAGTPSFTPAVVAGLETAETLKLLLGQESVLRNKLLTVDLMCQRYEITEFGV